jgi:hypothetical protein
MNEHPREPNLSRRRALAGIGAGGVVLAQFTSAALAQESSAPTETNASNIRLTRCPTVQGLKERTDLTEGEWVETAGFHGPGDGGGAFYQVKTLTPDIKPNEANVIELSKDLVALLQEGEAVNYRMFGAVGDGKQDDGAPIKLAHQYANERRIPVVNLSGEFWIKQTNAIPITTNAHWGQTILHIDEQYNDRRNPRFVVLNDRPARTLDLDANTKAALIEKIKPGVQIIPELAPYAGHLISVQDSEDRIGIRAGNYSKRGWAREELFYVEEEGRIIGDIAWEFKNFTSVTARPCNDNYLVIEGGGFYFSGDSAVASSRGGYHHNGIEIERSRTIIREQWMGLERGRQDVSMQPRRGFYVFNNVYDVTLENIRAMPWEKNRNQRDRVLSAGTYGIGGGRMLNCTFRNLTAEGGWVAWGVFGTNLNKNFRIENCRLNRIDVHFHCWNLYIRDCEIGFKGISVTGGGDLFVENTTRNGNHFLNFRRDYGAKWDGHVRLRGCTLKPTGNGTVRVLSHSMADFDYKYPIGFARSVKIEDLLIDFSTAPGARSPCWLMDIVPFSKTVANERLFFPNRVEFRNIVVEGRRQGVRLMRIPNPPYYDLRRQGDYDGSRLEPNCVFVFDNVQLERLIPEHPNDTERVHLLIGGESPQDYADELALHPEIHFIRCENVSLCLSHCIASAFLNQCSVNTLSAPALRGELRFNDCRFRPEVQQAPANLYTVESTLGTRFTNCTIHAPVISGKTELAMINQTGFLKVNESVQHYHLNTALGNEVVNHFRSRSIELTTDFIAKLKSHHELEG